LQRASYPKRTCREHTVPGPSGVTEYRCELEEYHAGPPASLSVPSSVAERDRWEAEHPGWEKQNDFADPFKEIKP
jgi:hypothetical protein